jgi:hypothetical protein
VAHTGATVQLAEFLARTNYQDLPTNVLNGLNVSNSEILFLIFTLSRRFADGCRL